MKLPRLAAALVLVLVASCINTTRSDGSVHRIAAPALASPLTETYPPPSTPSDDVQKAVFERINRDRASNGLAPVAWDPAAARVSKAFCEQQVRERSHGHYLMDGLPPYARMSFAGVSGFGAENSVSWVTTGISIEKELVSLALTGHDRMMEERPPKDGHRRAILDPEATHVGVGYFAEEGRLQISQEFLVRRLERLSLSRGSDHLPVLAVDGRVLAPDRIQFVTIAREPRPAQLTRKEANAHTSYAYPDAADAYIPEGYRSMRIVGTVTASRLRLKGDRDFSFTFYPVETGLFTFIFYVAPREGEKTRPAGSATVLFE
ncbi:MAG TPA: CAP domain-containing protein, partial [Thermoanaerobaculia bacterium]|nr:CAP domain-containing protein [Thermoanaerobaculia bacterium]